MEHYDPSATEDPNDQPEAAQEPDPTTDQPIYNSKFSTDFYGTARNITIGDTGLAVNDFERIFNIFEKLSRNATQRPTTQDVTDQNELVQRLSADLEEDSEQNRLPGSLYVGSGDEQAAIPHNRSELSLWYYQLDNYQRCFVRAAAVLHGSPTFVIKNAVDELMAANQHPIPPPSKAGSAPDDEIESVDAPLEQSATPILQGSANLLQITHLTISKVRSVLRLFWQDTDQQGNSAFALRILTFLVEETLLAQQSQSEQYFLAQLAQWPERFKGEAFWRSARALGAVHWTQSVDNVRRQANAWAIGERSRHWQCAASYLTGIYELGISAEERSSDDPRRAVLWILEQWIQRTHETAHSRIGSTVARTYKLIGRNDARTAIHGLDQLLYFVPQTSYTQAKPLPQEVLNESISLYTTYIWSGEIRTILTNLSTHATFLADPKSSMPMPLREAVLDSLFEIFYLIIATSLSTAKRGVAPLYDQLHLQDAPRIPDEQGREILLAGVVATDEPEWYAQLLILLSTMISAGREEAAFLLLHEWADHLFNTPADIQLPAGKRLTNFVIAIGTRVHQQYQDGLRRRPTHMIFKRNITHWQVQGRRTNQPISAFATAILHGLPF